MPMKLNPGVSFFIIPVVCMLSCTSGKVTASNKNRKQLKVACGKVAITADKPHIDWFEADAQLPTEMQLPKAYKAYTVEHGQLKRFFDAANAGEAQTTVPLPSPAGCIVFTVKPSGTLSEALRKKYPNMVSLSGTGSSGGDIRLDFDGEKMNGQVIHRSETYIISPTASGEKTYYLIYKKSDAGLEKQPFEAPDKR